MRGGYRPGSGPVKGTKYKPRKKKVNIEGNVPKKRGRPPKVKVDKVDKVDVTAIIKDAVIAAIEAKVKVKAKVATPEPVTPSPSLSTPSTANIPQDIIDDAALANLTPLDYMLEVMRDKTADPLRRDRMAATVAPYIHSKAGESGKKEEKADRAVVASKGKFAAGKPPTIALVK